MEKKLFSVTLRPIVADKRTDDNEWADDIDTKITANNIIDAINKVKAKYTDDYEVTHADARGTVVVD